MRATLSTGRHFVIDTVSPYIFGGFLEHMGRSVYEGVYDPGSAHADDAGLRSDVVAALRGLELTMVRYPGGNFVSGYHWRDGVGPRDERPTVRELAWQSIETNHFGTDEFMALCAKADWTPMFAANLGTGSPEEARDWVEYCNAPTGSRFADQRAANGNDVPHDIKYWCLGNEMDGPWQLGHVPAEQYAIRAQQSAKMMKDVDSEIVTVACGSSAMRMDTYLEWDRTVLEHLGPLADFISLHRYVGNKFNDTPNFLALGNSIDYQIESVDACCRYVAARQKSEKRAYLCFDEWNVWYKNRGPADMDGGGKFAPHLIEEVYNLEDALVVAGFLMSFIRHADCVKVANIAQLVNVIAPILTRGDEMLKQSIYYAFQMISRRKGGVALRGAIDGPSYDTATYGTASYLDQAITLDDDRLHLFLVNRSMDESLTLEVATDMALTKVIDAELLTGPHEKAHNDYDAPDVVVSQPFSDVALDGARATLTLPPLALVAATLEVAN